MLLSYTDVKYPFVQYKIPMFSLAVFMLYFIKKQNEGDNKHCLIA